ncbi:MAG: 3-oxoacyl-ACP reductase FabG [Gemmatimonadetes bacterium]|nr:3-oxoacyl-ACP reductase FabG [Gemmatimonadota bacterium]MYG23282.1 3-oxoacyl-ACP reductase FabG [Gemmatimonadota bacterium]MYJ37808.1 3-oxoacyl-ACP reductase FabG [Gemmatimonadota bacterium]
MSTDPDRSRAAGGPGDVDQAVGGAVAELLSEVTTRTEPEPLRESTSLRGQCAIVTGGSSGIGRATALTLAEGGVNIAFNYLDTGPESRAAAQELQESLARLEVKSFAQAGDVRDPDAATAFVAEANAQLGGLHILVNNAGVGRDRALWRMSNEEWQTVIDTNLSGAFYFTRAVAPYFRAQEFGKIVNVSSVHGLSSEFGLANYCSSKAGMIGLTRSTAVELGPSNVNVNAVAPGYIRTTQLTEHVPAEFIDRARERSALGRLGDPQDVASVILFLCSEVARHITGAVIPIDGGYLI